MKPHKLFLIVRWSDVNGSDYYKGQIVKIYEEGDAVLSTTIMKGVIVSDDKPIIFSSLRADEISHFVEDMDNITEEEKSCLKMNYPDLNIKFKEV